MTRAGRDSRRIQRLVQRESLPAFVQRRVARFFYPIPQLKLRSDTSNGPQGLDLATGGLKGYGF